MKAYLKYPVRIDKRVRLLLVPLFSLSVFFLKQKWEYVILGAVISILLIASGIIADTLKIMALMTGLCVLQSLIDRSGLNTGLLVVSILYISERLLVFVLLGKSVSKTMTMSEIIEALEQLKVPMQFILPFSVAMRFVPTIREEFGYIRDSMKIRGIESGITQVILHPVKSIEYYLIPIMIRSVKSADELCAAAMVKGIERRIK